MGATLARQDRKGAGMERTRQHTPEEIAAKLRQIGALVGQGVPVGEAIRRAGVSDSVAAAAILTRLPVET